MSYLTEVMRFVKDLNVMGRNRKLRYLGSKGLAFCMSSNILFTVLVSEFNQIENEVEELPFYSV